MGGINRPTPKKNLKIFFAAKYGKITILWKNARANWKNFPFMDKKEWTVKTVQTFKKQPTEVWKYWDGTFWWEIPQKPIRLKIFN